jgi:hypothetical protein
VPEFILETLTDTLKSLPILFLVYFIIEIIQKKLNAQKLLKYKDHLLGPPLGAVAGCIPQCGFSAASATLYHSGVIGAGTLIAVFVSTSDEALPIMISHASSWEAVLQLIVIKLLIAVIAGYLFMYTVFRKERLTPKSDPVDLIGCDHHCHEHHSRSILKNAVTHTIQTTIFICITLLAINFVIFLIGEERVQALLMTESVFQPFLTALIGLVPGCATSVFLTELFLQGSISFASAIAGLSTGAGFGFLVLFKSNHHHAKQNLKILLCVYFTGAIAGMLLQFIL